MPYLRIMRPTQWTKNLFLFAGVVFGHKLTEMAAVRDVLLGFLCFSVVSSAVYIFNDVRDRNEDRQHPRKCRRPVAAGEISPMQALLFMAVLLVVGLGGGLALDQGFFVVLVAYLVLQAGYTLGLKQVVLLDVILIGMGFVLRAIAGALLVHVEISHWLVLCTFTLCLFMGFSKRRCELDVITARNGDVTKHRRTLAEYTPELLNHMTTVTAGIAVVTFILYATDERTIKEFGSIYLVYTVPIVVYAIFRFALLVEHGRVDGPTAVLTRDWPFQAAIVLWGVAVLIIVYGGADLREWVNEVLQR